MGMKKIFQKKNKFLLVIILLLFLIGCKKETKKISEEKFLFGTYIKIIIYSNNEKEAKESIKLAFNKIEEIDKKYNSKNKDSLIYKLNNSSEKKVKVDKELLKVLSTIEDVYELSDNMYDITISPLLDLWGFGKKKKNKIPNKSEIEKVLKNINFEKVKEDNGFLYLENGVKEIDTGSFLKGYAISQARKLLLERNEKNVFITSISSIATIGNKKEDKPWKIGIQDPSNVEKTLGVIEISNESLGISGDYQTYIEIEGKKYHHLMSKKTGYPISDKKMVVVICNSAFLADVYSTAFFGMKVEEIFRVAEKENLKVLIVDSDNMLKMTKNFILK